MLTLGAWLHDLDPYAFRLSGGFGLRWYGLAYVAGFIAAWLVLVRLARRGRILIGADRVPDLILAVVVGTLVGGRLGYVLIYQPSLLVEFTSSAPWWGLLAINNGGMASHGGMIGIILACWMLARWCRVPALHVMDLMALVAPIGIFFGRMANFVNGELLGRVAAPPGEPAPWWSVKYPQELLERFGQPSIEDGTSLLTTPHRVPGELTPMQAEDLRAALSLLQAPEESNLELAAVRAVDLIQAGDAQAKEVFAPLLTARHPSQLYQALAEGVILGILLWFIWMKPRRPGVVGAWFLIIYGVGRIATEFVRLPDSHLAVQRIMGLSRGQWLSALMIIAGAVALAWITSRKDVLPVGGWRGASAQTSGASDHAAPAEPEA